MFMHIKGGTHQSLDFKHQPGCKGVATYFMTNIYVTIQGSTCLANSNFSIVIK